MIRRLLEVSKRELHCKVLLTPENISSVRHNLAPYNFPVIPRPLPTDVVEGEHFIVSDLWHLVSRGPSSSRDPTVKALSGVQGVGSTSGASTSLSGSSGSSPSPPRFLIREVGAALPVQVAGSASRVVRIRRKGAPERRNVPGSKEEDFVPWVPADSEEPQDLEEEERRERITRLLDCNAARKRKRQVISSSKSDPAPVHNAESSLSATDGQPVTDGILGGPRHHNFRLSRTRADRWSGTGRGWPIRT